MLPYFILNVEFHFPSTSKLPIYKTSLIKFLIAVDDAAMDVIE